MLDPNYLAMAADARATASLEVLENVRQKHLTAAATWEGLAHTASKVAELRTRRLAERPVATDAIALPVRTRTRVRRPTMIG